MSDSTTNCNVVREEASQIFSSQQIDEWVEGQLANAAEPSPETLARVAALLHAAVTKH